MNAQRKQTLLQRRVDQWNAANPVGTEVDLRRDVSQAMRTKTRSPAWVMSGHSAVVLLEGISGCYALDRCTPVGDKGMRTPEDVARVICKIATAGSGIDPACIRSAHFARAVGISTKVATRLLKLAEAAGVIERQPRYSYPNSYAWQLAKREGSNDA